MLRRCHPSIAAVSNHSFYGGRLLDGCTAAERGPLLPGLPPLLCLDVRGSQQYASGSGSASNQAEARAVVQVTVPSRMWCRTPPCASRRFAMGEVSQVALLGKVIPKCTCGRLTASSYLSARLILKVGAQS